MILMWLGSFVLMMFGLNEAQKHMAAMFADWQKPIYEKNHEGNLKKTFLQTLGIVLLEVSPLRSLYTGLALYNLRILPLRQAVLMMCLSTVGAWWVLLVASLFLNLNGFFLLGVCTLGLLSYGLTGKFEKALKVLFALGVFLVGGESLIRNSSIIQTLLGQSELAFFLADGRFTAVLAIALAGFVLGLFVRYEFWALILGMGLLVTNTISFNGALALVTAERLAQVCVLWYRSRSLNQDCQRLGKQFALVSVVGLVLGFWFAGELRTLIGLGFSSDMTAFQEKNLQFICLFGLILGVQFVAQMIWGHFAGTMAVDELQEAKYFPSSWSHNEVLSYTAKSWAKDKVHKRLSEIRYHLAGLGALKEGQVPEHIQQRLRDEEKQLSHLLVSTLG